MNFKTRIWITYYLLTRLKRRKALLWSLSTIAFIVGIGLHVAGESEVGLYVLVGILLIELIVRIFEIWEMAEPRYTEMEVLHERKLPADTDGTMISVSDLTAGIDGPEASFAARKRASDIDSIINSSKVDENLLEIQRLQKCMPFIVRKNYEKRLLSELKCWWEDFEDYLSVFAIQNSKKHLFLEYKIALASRFNEDTKNVEIGKTTYFTSLLTNEASTAIIKKGKETISDLRMTFPLDDMNRGCIKPIEISSMSNHIGISTLALTKDGYIVIFRQNARAQQQEGFLVPSGSGSLDWSDKEKSNSGNFIDVVRYGMARELQEETCLDHDLIPDIAKQTLVIGYFRWIRRGGKPEFIGITKLPVDIAAIKADQNEVTRNEKANHGAKIPTPYAQSVKQVLSLCENYINNPEVGITLWAILSRLHSILSTGSGNNQRMQLISWWGLIDD